MRSLQDLTFPPRIQGGIQRDNQTGKKGKCLTDRKTLASFYQILWDPFMAQLFSPGSRMASQGTTKGTKKGKCLTGRKTLSFCCGILWGPSRTSLFPPGSRMGSQGTTKGTNRKMLDRRKTPCKFLLNFMKSFQDFTFSTRIQDGTPRDDQRDQKGKWLLGPCIFWS